MKGDIMQLEEINKEYTACIRCGRKLKSEESRKLGFGKVCWEKWQADTRAKKLFNVDRKAID